MNERDIIKIREAGVKLNLDEEEVIGEMQKIPYQEIQTSDNVEK